MYSRGELAACFDQNCQLPSASPLLLRFSEDGGGRAAAVMPMAPPKRVKFCVDPMERLRLEGTTTMIATVRHRVCRRPRDPDLQPRQERGVDRLGDGRPYFDVDRDFQRTVLVERHEALALELVRIARSRSGLTPINEKSV
jgi:hypothetical protein